MLKIIFLFLMSGGIPVAMAMAGGYGVDIEDTVQVQVNTFAVAAAHWQRWQNRRP